MMVAVLQEVLFAQVLVSKKAFTKIRFFIGSGHLLYLVVPTYLQVISVIILTGKYRSWELDMAKCPNCGKEVSKPDKSFKNVVFHIEAYTCPECKHHFHQAR